MKEQRTKRKQEIYNLQEFCQNLHKLYEVPYVNLDVKYRQFGTTSTYILDMEDLLRQCEDKNIKFGHFFFGGYFTDAQGRSLQTLYAISDVENPSQENKTYVAINPIINQ